MATRKGFEPPTDGLGSRCSVLLSYRVKLPYHYNIFFKKPYTFSHEFGCLRLFQAMNDTE